jgi:hypothetical protein
MKTPDSINWPRALISGFLIVASSAAYIWISSSAFRPLYLIIPATIFAIAGYFLVLAIFPEDHSRIIKGLVAVSAFALAAAAIPNMANKPSNGNDSPASPSKTSPNGQPNAGPSLVSPTSTASQVAAGLHFITPETVPECTTVQGTGTIPSGYTVLLFDRSVDAGHHPEGKQLFDFLGPANPLPDKRWGRGNVRLGDGGPAVFYAEVAGVLFERATANEFAANHTPQAGLKIDSQLVESPEDGVPLHSLFVRRTQEKGSC